MTIIETEHNLIKMADNLTSNDDDNSASSNPEEQSDVSDISEKESDVSDASDKESDISEDGLTEANAAWADSIAKILKTKKPKGKRTLVLSKAKKLTDVVKKEKPEDVGFQIEGEIKEEKPDEATLLKIKSEIDEPPKKKRKELPSIRTKPNILDKDRERTLSKIATRGVVQLFNSVRMQQKDINVKLQEAGPLERKRENVMKSIDKKAFLDVLMKNKSQPVDGPVKTELKDEKQKDSTWNVLRDDFMMDAKLKDWDKNLEEDNEEDEIVDMSDSD